MCSIPIHLLDKIQDKILTPVLPDNVLVLTPGSKQSKKKTDMLPKILVTKYQPMPCNIPEQPRPELHHRRSQIARESHKVVHT